jgi:hypothetical protein
MLRDLASTGYSGFLSVELFNESYWQQDLRRVARAAREKTQSIISAAVEQRRVQR